MPPTPAVAPAIIEFPPFTLDLRAGQLRRDATPVPLRPKTFAVLQYLAERPGELVTKQSLLDAVWNDVVVSEDVARLSVGELRVALRDDRTAPRFIETVRGRGYRFVAMLGAAHPASMAQLTIDDSSAADGSVVGRTGERTEIADWLRAAMSGRRQIGFISGEAGIGKTTLIDTVLRALRRASGAQLRIARGQCVEYYGGGEPYLPVLEAMATLCRGPGGQAAEASLRDHAPDWFVGAMGLLASREVDRVEPAASARKHTLHRLAASIEALAADTPLVLVLEDVHWSDYSTLDLLGVVARRREPARLLVLCSLRPAEAIMRGHPVATVKRELQRTRLCREILLGGLSATDIASYLAARFPGADLPENLLPLLVDRSEGNPFFMVALVDHLVEQRLLAKSGSRWELRGDLEALRTAIPDGLRAVVEPRLERLAPEELRVLEAASVAGLEFAAHAIAGVAPHSGDVVYVERLCDTLVRRQEILRAAGESAWPDATSSARYVFRHALYQQVIYQRLSASTRRRLHETIGKRLEAAHGERTAEVAGQLAAHFERSGDIDRAVRYHGEAAALASSRFAYQETRLHLEAALDLGHQQPETPERLRREMVFLQDLGATLFAIKGYGDEGGARAFARMRELAERLDGALTRFNAMQGQLIVHTMRAELATARALGEEMLVLAERLGKPVEVADTHVVLSATLFNLGEVEAARHHAERGRALLDPDAPPLPTDVTIPSAILVASTCGYLGLVARARAMNREALASATTPFHRALATNLASQVCMLLDDVPGARSLAEEAVHLAREYDLAVFGLTATMVRGWCDVEEGRVEDGRAAVQAAFHEYGATGQRFGTTCFSLLLARAHLAAGDAVSAHQAVDAALVFAAETGERVYEPELHRLQGECFRASAATRGQKARATECFERALAIAADRKGLLFELRAATSLFRHRGTAARERLVRLVDRFAAEDDCADLHAARALLGPTEPTPSDRRTRRFPQLA